MTYGSHRISVRSRARRESALLRREADVVTYTADGPPAKLAKAVAEVVALRKALGVIA